MKAKPYRPENHKMNKTESLYARRLENMRAMGNIHRYEFEPLKLRLADSTFYTPDFMVVRNDLIELHEVKGFWRDDARVKIKVAAKQFPEFKFVAVQKSTAKERARHGEWKIEEF